MSRTKHGHAARVPCMVLQKVNQDRVALLSASRIVWSVGMPEAVAERYRAAGWTVVPGAFCLVFTAPAPSE